MDILTARQQQIFGFILKTIRTYLRPPTYREMMREFGVRSLNGIHEHVAALERRGYVRFYKMDKKSRSMFTLTDEAREAYGLTFQNGGNDDEGAKGVYG